MRIRETLNKPAVRTGAVIVLPILVAFLLWKTFFGNDLGRAKAFYSDDDGKTWFVDRLTNFPPFDHNGKQAYRAQVFRCGQGPPFVAYLESYTPEGQAHLKRAGNDTRAVVAALQEVADQALAKKPGAAAWVPAKKVGQYAKVTTPVCPDGSAKDLVQVAPGE